MGEVYASELRGKFDHKLDPKGRVAVPADWVNGQEISIYLLESSREGLPTLRALTNSKLAQMEQTVRDHPSLTPAQKDSVIGKLNADCIAASINAQGKLGISKRLCERLELENDVKLVGRGDYFEIWRPEIFAKAESLELEKLASINAELGFF